MRFPKDLRSVVPPTLAAVKGRVSAAPTAATGLIAAAAARVRAHSGDHRRLVFSLPVRAAHLIWRCVRLHDFSRLRLRDRLLLPFHFPRSLAHVHWDSGA